MSRPSGCHIAIDALLGKSGDRRAGSTKAAAGKGAPLRTSVSLSLLVTALLATSVGLESPAHALGPIDLEAGLRVGAATNPDADLPANPLGFGVGGRAGVGVFGLYGGVSAMHYLGGSGDVGPATIDYSATLVGFEAGYTIKSLPVVNLRPQLGVGSATLSASGANVDSSEGHLYLEPGLTAIVPIGLFFVGADVNALFLPGVDRLGGDSTTYVSFTMHGQLGLRL